MNCKFFFSLLLILVTITTVSSYTIVCTEENRGIRIWNLNQTFNETGWTLEEIEAEEGLDCTLIEASVVLRDECKEFEPIIEQLNQNLKDAKQGYNLNLEDAYKKVERYNLYRLTTFIFVITTVILTIMLKMKINRIQEVKNGTEKR